MKVCLLNNTYYPYHRGGSDRITSIIYNELKRRQNTVYIITIRPRFDKSDAEANGVRYLSSLFPYLNRLPKSLRLVWHIIDLCGFRKFLTIYRFLRENKPDLVITNNLKGLSALTPLAIKLAHCPHCHILHDIQLIHPSGLLVFGHEQTISTWLAGVYSFCHRILAGSIDVVISPSNWLMALHQDRGFFKKAKRLIRYNPVNLPSVANEKAAIQPNSLIFIGELTVEKGIITLLAAMKQVGKQFPQAVCHIAGRGPLQPLVSRAGANIVYHGFLPNEEARRLLSRQSCLITPSLCYENSPTVIFEAIEHGMPFICSALGGNLEIAENFGGITFQPGNADDLAKKIVDLLRAPIRPADRQNMQKLRQYGAAAYVEMIVKSIF